MAQTANHYLGEDYVILDGVSDGGHYVGTYLAISTLQRYWWGEGEIKFFLDGDNDYPTVCSTGTEDYFGGAWSFAEQRDGHTRERTFCAPICRISILFCARWGYSKPIS